MPEAHDDTADLMIRDAFRSTARPIPTPHFDRRLRIALAEEKLRLRSARTRMRWMRAYWLAVAAATIGILSILPWSESPGGAWIPLLVVTAMAALPAVLARIDLVDLILGSAEGLRGHGSERVVGGIERLVGGS